MAAALMLLNNTSKHRMTVAGEETLKFVTHTGGWRRQLERAHRYMREKEL